MTVTTAFAPNSTSADAAEYYAAKLAEMGVKPESLSFAEVVEVTRQFYPEFQGSDFRKDRLAARKAEKDIARKAAAEKRNADAIARATAARAAAESKIAELAAKFGLDLAAEGEADKEAETRG